MDAMFFFKLEIAINRTMDVNAPKVQTPSTVHNFFELEKCGSSGPLQPGVWF